MQFNAIQLAFILRLRVAACLTMNFASLLSDVRSPPTPRARRLRWIVALVLIYTVAGFFVLPPIIKWQLVKRLPEITHRQVAVKQVKINPYALSLTIRGLSLMETNGEPFAGFDEFYVNFELSSLFRWAWTFSEIKLEHPTANLVRGSDGQFNFANLISREPGQQPAPAKRAKPLPMLLVQHLVVTNGDFNVADLTRHTPFRIDYGPINLDLKNFTTRRNKDGLYSLAVTTGAGGDFSWSGTIAANPPESTGKFMLRGVVLKTYSPYLADFARADITDGVLDVGAEYRLNAEASPFALDVTNANVKLTNFKLTATDSSEVLLGLDDVAVTHASASLAARDAHVPLVTVHGGSLLARREKDGQLNWLKLLTAQTNAPQPAIPETNSTSQSAAPWKASIDEFNLDGFVVTADDHVPPTPAQIGLDDLHVNLKGLSNQSNAPVTSIIGFNWRGGGKAQVAAKGTLLPPAAEAEVAIAELALPPLQPYVEQQARVVLNAGALSVNGHATYAPVGMAAPKIQFTGDVSIAKFASVDTVAYQELASWDALNLRGIRLMLQTNAVNVDEIKFTGMRTSLVVSSNGELAVQALMKTEPATSPASNNPPAENISSEATPPPTSIPIKIASLVFEKCSFRAADHSLTPHFDTSIEEFNGTIRDLALPGLNKAAVDIRGKVSALAPFEASGQITPDAKNPYVDLKLKLKNDDLTPFTPYAEKYAGHPLNKGKLSFDLSYKIQNRKLEATNIIALDQFTLGARNNSTNATKLPVKLGVALLKDRNGRIDLDLPVSGSLDDPKFSISALVWKAIVNILTKVATSPFSLLGAMFGGGEELQYVDFAPGVAILEPAQTNKLNTLAKALFERPALNLEISASADPVADREMLSRQKLRTKMKSLRLQELSARGKPVSSLDEFQIEPADYQRLLRRTYKEAFKIEPERALREAATAAAVTNAAAAAEAGPFASSQSKEIVKGATQLIQVPQVQPGLPSTTQNAGAPAVTASVRPKTADQIVLEEMERRLMATIPATDDDVRELLTQRCASVQKFLLETGKVNAERVFIVAPKPLDPTMKSMARATFSLG